MYDLVPVLEQKPSAVYFVYTDPDDEKSPSLPEFIITLNKVEKGFEFTNSVFETLA